MSRKLRELLRNRNPSLCSEVEAIIRNVTALLAYAPASFPTGTNHTAAHTSTVELIASLLLPEDLLTRLRDHEIALLLLSCHLHDLGMVGTEEDIATQESRDQLRVGHAIDIGTRIRENWRGLGFSTEAFAEIAANVCKGHRPNHVEGHATWSNLREIGIFGPDKSVRLRVLSALIFAIDELHIGADRAPKLDEDWIKIHNPISKMHWHRHQCIHGPVECTQGLTFHIRVTSEGEEEDLATNVLVKAIAAVADANAELEKAALPSLNHIYLEWIREDSILLQTVLYLSDLEPRTRNALTSHLESVHSKRQSPIQGHLAAACTELPSLQDFANAVASVIDDAIVTNVIEKSDQPEDHLTLSTKVKAINRVFDLAARADSSLAAIGKRLEASYEFDLLATKFGSQYAKTTLTENVLDKFGIDLRNSENAYLLAALSCTPSARRVFQTLTPFPSIHQDEGFLLTIGLLAAVSFDIQRRPSLMLDSGFRAAVAKLSSDIGNSMETFLKFQEELSLVVGYSESDVRDALLNDSNDDELSEEAVTEDEKQSSEDSIVVRTTYNPKHPRASVSPFHLVLTSMRTGIHVSLSSIPESTLEIIPPKSLQTKPIKSFAIGPTPHGPPDRIYSRASLELDCEAGCITALLQPLNSSPTLHPLLLSISNCSEAGKINRHTRLRFYPCAMTCQNIVELALIIERHKDIEIRIASDGEVRGEARLPVSDLKLGEFLSTIDIGLAQEVCRISPRSFFPFGVSTDAINRILKEPDGIQLEQKRIIALNVQSKRKISTLFLRYATIDSIDVYEEYLGFVGNFLERMPNIVLENPSSTCSIESLWETSNEVSIQGFFQASVLKLAASIKKWRYGPVTSFPFSTTSDPPSTPNFRTHFEILRMPLVDRGWYAERPIIARLRPMRDEERWRIEADYWRSIGDIQRTELLNERLSRIDATKRQ